MLISFDLNSNSNIFSAHFLSHTITYWRELRGVDIEEQYNRIYRWGKAGERGYFFKYFIWTGGNTGRTWTIGAFRTGTDSSAIHKWGICRKNCRDNTDVKIFCVPQNTDSTHSSAGIYVKEVIVVMWKNEVKKTLKTVEIKPDRIRKNEFLDQIYEPDLSIRSFVKSQFFFIKGYVFWWRQNCF